MEISDKEAAELGELLTAIDEGQVCKRGPTIEAWIARLKPKPRHQVGERGYCNLNDYPAPVIGTIIADCGHGYRVKLDCGPVYLIGHDSFFILDNRPLTSNELVSELFAAWQRYEAKKGRTPSCSEISLQLLVDLLPAEFKARLYRP